MYFVGLSPATTYNALHYIIFVADCVCLSPFAVSCEIDRSHEHDEKDAFRGSRSFNVIKFQCHHQRKGIDFQLAVNSNVRRISHGFEVMATYLSKG